MALQQLEKDVCIYFPVRQLVQLLLCSAFQRLQHEEFPHLWPALLYQQLQPL